MADEKKPLLRILVVDDCAEAAGGLASLLTSWGHEVRVAPDGFVALALGVAYRPDVVLLELSIPQLDGAEVARLLRAQAGAPLLLLALSEDSDLRRRRLADEAGFDSLLLLPLRPEELRRALASARC